MASHPDAIIRTLMRGNIGLLGRCWRQSPQSFPHSARACLGLLRHCRNYGSPFRGSHNYGSAVVIGPSARRQFSVSKSSPQSVPWPAVAAAVCAIAFFPPAASEARAWQYGAANAAARSRRDVDAVGSLITPSMYCSGVISAVRAADRGSTSILITDAAPDLGLPAPGLEPPRPGVNFLISVIF